MKLRLTLLLCAIFGLFASSSAAEANIQDYGVYRIDQAYQGDAYRGKSMSVTGTGNIIDIISNSNDEKQLWVAVPNEAHTGFYLRNYVTGFYMASPIQKNANWYATTPENLDDERSVFTTLYRSATDDNLIYPISIIGTSNEGTQNGYAHAIEAGSVICYGMGAGASGWNFVAVKKTAEEVSARMERWGMSPVERNAAYTITDATSGLAMAVDAESGQLTLTDNIDPADPAQIWITESHPSGTAYYIRNLLTGYYLTSPLTAGAPWRADYSVMPVDNSMALKVEYPATGGDGAIIYPLSNESLADPTSLWTFNKTESFTNEIISGYKQLWYTYARGIVDGHVYRIVNVNYGRAMTAPGKGNVTATAVNPDEDSQLWVAQAKRDGNGYYLRNLKTGYYLYSPRTKSGNWTAHSLFIPCDDNILLNFIPTGTHYFIIPTSAYGKTGDEQTYGYAHESGQANVVGWSTDTPSTMWDFVEESSITPGQLAEKKASWITNVSEVTPGIYRIQNVNYGTYLAPNGTNLRGLAADKADISQLWIVEPHPDSDEGYIIRSYQTGRALSNPRTTSNPWITAEKYVPGALYSALYFNRKDNGFGISTVSSRGQATENNDYTYAHINSSNSVVCWSIGSNSSRWLFQTAGDITADDLKEQQKQWTILGDYSIEHALTEIFADAACTEFTPQYAAMTQEQIQNDPTVNELPEALKAMVVKMAFQNWTETDPATGLEWDSDHARKFRVQIYEPYTDCDQATHITKTWAYTNLNNPTGIVADSGSVLYVMVDKEPADGSTLSLAMFNDVQCLNPHTVAEQAPGVKLNKGLNVITCDKDLASLIIYYTVYTNGRQHSIKNYEDIKIHIEGGSLNGYFNACGDELYTPDTNEDWLYYRERARHDAFFFLTKYATLDVLFNDYTYSDGSTRTGIKTIYTPEKHANGVYDFPAVCRAWDQICLQQHLVMGTAPNDDILLEKEAGRNYYDPLGTDDITRDDYPDYFNSRILVLTLKDNYMNAVWHRLAFEPGIVTYMLHEFPTGDLWGPAHEFGHMNQPPINVVGTQEISNNLFSNVSLFYRGAQTSRADYPSVQRQRFNQGQTYSQHGTWGGTRMFFQLWLYYHAIGHNKLFYPRLYELLRNNPLHNTALPAEGENHYNIKGNYLHFAKLACIAAGEDLTDFFESWGFLQELNGFQIPETNCIAHLTAEDIAEFRAEIAALAAENNWKKNEAIIFIDDRVGSVGKQSYGFDNTRCGEMGGLNDFANGAPVSGNYVFHISGNSISVSGGEGGVGFIIRDNNGKLIGFSNDRNFTVNEATAELIRNGEATIDIMQADNQPVEVADAVRGGTIDQRLQAMDALLSSAAALLAKADSTKVGYFRPEVMAELRTVYNSTKAMRDNNEITVDNNVELYETLQSQFVAHSSLTATADNTTTLIAGAIYVFTDNILRRGTGITSNANGTNLLPVTGSNLNPADEAQQWEFIATDEPDYYFIRNIKNNKYINRASADKAAVAMSNNPMKQLVMFRELGGVSISPLGSDHDSFHADDSNRLTRWDSDAKASRWTLSLLDGWEAKANKIHLNEAISSGEALIARAGSVSVNPDGTPTATVNEEYNMVTPAMIETLHTLIAEAKALLAGDSPSADAMGEKLRELTLAITELTDAMNRNSSRLVDLIAETLKLINTLGNVSEELIPIELTADNLYSNAPHTSGGGSDQFSTWDVLLDKNHNTYFHSNYTNSVNSADGLDHYIRIELPQARSRAGEQEGNPMVFHYVTRNSTGANWYPAEATLEYSTDSLTWHHIANLADELPFASAATFESDPFTVPTDARYIRFMVQKSRQTATDPNQGTAAGHNFFVVSEIGLSKHSVSAEPNTDSYPNSNEETLKAAMTQTHIAQKALTRPRYKNANYDSAYEALLPHYNNLVEIAQNTTSIEEIPVSNLENAEIFTTDGIRIDRIRRPGIYIVNGKKTLIR